MVCCEQRPQRGSVQKIDEHAQMIETSNLVERTQLCGCDGVHTLHSVVGQELDGSVGSNWVGHDEYVACCNHSTDNSDYQRIHGHSKMVVL